MGVTTPCSSHQTTAPSFKAITSSIVSTRGSSACGWELLLSGSPVHTVRRLGLRGFSFLSQPTISSAV